jgi:hypothetical protein
MEFVSLLYMPCWKRIEEILEVDRILSQGGKNEATDEKEN